MGTTAPRFRWLFVVAIAAVVLIGWATSSATSAPSGLTKSKAKKLFYTKKAADNRYLTQGQADGRYLTQSQADGRYLTQAQGDSRYLTPSQADSRYLSAGGQTTLQASPTAWQQTNGAFSGGNVGRDSSGISLTTGVATSAALEIGPTFPSDLAGQPMELVSVNACYNNGTGSTLTSARINVATTTTGSPNTVSPIIDGTPRTDDACRTYTPASPVPIASSDTVTFQLLISFAGGGGQSFSASRATFSVQAAD